MNAMAETFIASGLLQSSEKEDFISAAQLDPSEFHRFAIILYLSPNYVVKPEFQSAPWWI